MNPQSSRNGSMLGSSQNVSQLSLYSQATSSQRSERTQGSFTGRGYLTSARRTVGRTSRDASTLLSQARSRRQQERRRQTSSAEARTRKIEDGSSDNANGDGDLDSYLMSFGKAGQNGARNGASRDKRLPKGSDIDWAKLMESNSDAEQRELTVSDLDDQSDHSDNVFLKTTTRDIKSAPQASKEKRRRISQEIKYLDEKSSPSISEIVVTDSLDTSTQPHTPMAGEHPHVQGTRTKNILSDSESSAEGRNLLEDVMDAADLISRSKIGSFQSLSKSKLSATRLDLREDDGEVFEADPISKSIEFGRNVVSSLDHQEADETPQHTSGDTSTFEQHLHDVHSLSELEELVEDSAPLRDSAKESTKVKIHVDSNHRANRTIKMSSSTKREPPAPVGSPRVKQKQSSFKFSAAATADPGTNDTLFGSRPGKSIDYSSDGFESESVSEEVTSVDNGVEEAIEEESVLESTLHQREDLAGSIDDSEEETVRSEVSSDVEREGGEYTEHEPSYSSFVSEDEQTNMSELTESQQMEQSTIHQPKKNAKPVQPKATPGIKDASVQTEALTSTAPPSIRPLSASYLTVAIGEHYGKEHLDPSPILPYVVSPDALEVVTGYTPSVVALTDMLRTQLSITRSLVARSRQLAASVSDSITPNHHYTTLEETKEYIARHRPRLLSFKDARKLVQSER